MCKFDFTKLKPLKEKHIKYLLENGFNPKEFLYKKADADSFTFYHIGLGKLFTMRR